MGCIWSTLDKEEIVQRCKERKRLMKQLVGFRAEFATAQMAYLRSLRNTGITLRQFTEGDQLELESMPIGLRLPPSPPPPLPPSPPPPPPFSPDEKRIRSDSQKQRPDQEEYTEIDEDNISTPPPPPVHNSAWDFWDPFDPSSSPVNRKKHGEEVRQADEDEDWAETKTEFEEEQEDDGGVVAAAQPLLPKKSPPRELMDDNSSTVSWCTKDTTDMAMVVWRSKKTLVGIVKELDDYFLKASEGVKEIGVLLEANHGKHLPQNFEDTNSKKSCKSAKVFSALSWSWSSKSLLSSRDAFEFHVANEPSKLGGLCRTLDKLYAEERKLYEEIKEEETVKLQLQKRSILLQKQETGDQDWMKIDNTRSSIETLQSEILCIQESIGGTCLSMLKLRDEELYPQLLELSYGLMQMWRTMYECHQVQNHIAQQMNHLNNHLSTEPTTDYHRHATVQFEAEVTSWHNTFCNLLTSQREFVRALNQWVQLTDLLSNYSPTNSTSEIGALCKEWELALERLPDKVASEAIKSFIYVIHSMVLQHSEECKLQKKSTRLEKRLEKQLNLLTKMEKKSDEILNASGPSPSDSFLVEREKTDTLKKKVDEERDKYLNSVRISHSMMLNNLQTGLPNVFQAMTGFANVCTQAFEAVNGHSKVVGRQDESMPSQFPLVNQAV